MTKKIIIVALILTAMVVIYAGFLSMEIQKADAEEQIVYTVHVMKTTEYGYVPKHDFEISKPTLEAYVKMCWFEASRLNSGDLLLAFDADDEVWLVKIAGNDPEIQKLKNMVDRFGLLCPIPD